MCSCLLQAAALLLYVCARLHVCEDDQEMLGALADLLTGSMQGLRGHHSTINNLLYAMWALNLNHK